MNTCAFDATTMLSAPLAGRGGNQWTSPAGCLMFTTLRRLQLQGAQAPFLNYVVCLAVLKGIKACAAQWLGQVGADADM